MAPENEVGQRKPQAQEEGSGDGRDPRPGPLTGLETAALWTGWEWKAVSNTDVSALWMILFELDNHQIGMMLLALFHYVIKSLWCDCLGIKPSQCLASETVVQF